MLTASAENGSEHPLGRAIVVEAEKRGMLLRDPEGFKSFRGAGVRAEISGREVLAGNPNWFEETGLKLGDHEKEVRRLQAQGKSVIVVALEKEISGVIAVADKVKPESGDAIERLHKQNLQVIMLTGDNVQTALAIASEVNIKEVFAEVRPDEKSLKIKELQRQGKKVGMVGDGINDAPALAQADVGIAIGTGTDVAIEAGDVVLGSGSLMGVPRAIELSRATMRTIRQNLFWAFFYNIILIPVAAGALYPLTLFPDWLRQLHPIVAAFAMAISSIFVVSNSLLLYRQK
jgi:Cu+-exporting ATPase